MKYVPPGGEPGEYTQWKQENRAIQNPLPFDALGFPRTSVKAALLSKQGWICPYTLLTIASVEACHIEHVMQQATYPELAAEFNNMLACYPETGGKKIGFGAPEKGNKDGSRDNFLSPFEKACEVRCQYQQDGSITGQDKRASQTIDDVLKLNHPSLREKRVAAFRGCGISVRPSRGKVRRPNPASLKQARYLATQIMQKDGSGRLASFCVAIHQVAQIYVDILQNTETAR